MFVKLGPPGRKNKAETIVIHDYDTWNIDVTLAHIIVPMLKQLKEKKHGAPFVDNEDVSALFFLPGGPSFTNIFISPLFSLR